MLQFHTHHLPIKTNTATAICTQIHYAMGESGPPCPPGMVVCGVAPLLALAAAWVTAAPPWAPEEPP